MGVTGPLAREGGAIILAVSGESPIASADGSGGADAPTGEWRLLLIVGESATCCLAATGESSVPGPRTRPRGMNFANPLEGVSATPAVLLLPVPRGLPKSTVRTRCPVAGTANEFLGNSQDVRSA
ncbi:hypothetical protein KC357_g75 [Hortaea werneckii]|nr:hypothetical protein KC357_g75 [Hortaea werneckii]